MEDIQVTKEEQEALVQEMEQAKQEEYYWHVIAEFYGLLKVFGTKKVMADFQSFKNSVEPKERPKFLLPY